MTLDQAREALERAATPRFGCAVADWHEWFAWRPIVTFDGRWTWMRVVLRRRIQKHSHLWGGPDFWWQYARTLKANTEETA